MSVSLDEVRHLAALSEINLNDDELTSLTTDIDNIVDYINQLDELDTDNVEPTFQLTGCIISGVRTRLSHNYRAKSY